MSVDLPHFLCRPHMGTGGVQVIRDRGWYFVWTVSHTGYPEHGLGAKVYRMILKNAQDLESWRQELREDLVELRHTYNTHADENGILYGEAKDINGIIDIRITQDWTYEKDLYVYEIDLDNMLFIYQRYPVYHLDHMPPEEVFLRSCNILDGEWDSGLIDDFYEDTPEEYRFSLSRLSQLAPEVEDLEIATYEESSIEFIMDPPSILLSSPPDLTSAEDVSLRLLASVLYFYRDEQRAVMYHELALINDRRIISERGWEMCSFFAAMSLFPLHILGPAVRKFFDTTSIPWPKFFSRSREDFWFVRKHICITFGAHLHDERNAKYHISRLIDKVVSTRNTPDVTYGVVFSLFHCVVVRIDKFAARCHFSRTEVLEFLPPLFEERFEITPGMQLLTKLGHLKGKDDLDVFYTWLSTQWWNYAPGGYTPEPRTEAPPTDPTRHASHTPRLPLEIMMMIASEIVWPQHLFNFALASKFHMTAAMPRLRLPQVWGVVTQYYRRDPRLGYILDSCATDSLPTTFRVRHGRDPALLQLKYSKHITCTRMNESQRSGMMQWNGGTPRAYLTFGKSRGYYKYDLWRDDDLYSAYSDPHAEVGFIVGWEAESENEDSVTVDE
ncbi:hypothetical protein EIP86_004657 [Pleurotus ostreatoroseus]|nr:hypothetical protein EIP86_004657 [Pleurotus ostreatoroseus]